MENISPQAQTSNSLGLLVLAFSLLALVSALGLASHAWLTRDQVAPPETESQLSTLPPIVKVNPPIAQDTYSTLDDQPATQTALTSYQGNRFELRLPSFEQFKSLYFAQEESESTIIRILNEEGSLEKGHILIKVELTDTTLTAKQIQQRIFDNPGEGYPYDESFLAIAGIESYKEARSDADVIENYYVPYSNALYTFEFEYGKPDEHYPEYIADYQREIAAIMNGLTFGQ